MNKNQYNQNFKKAHPDKWREAKRKHDIRVWCYICKLNVRLGHFGYYPEHFLTK